MTMCSRGSEIEGMISGRPASDCEEAAGATRIKRLRDTLGNQIVSELLVKNIARRGYMLCSEQGRHKSPLNRWSNQTSQA